MEKPIGRKVNIKSHISQHEHMKKERFTHNISFYNLPRFFHFILTLIFEKRTQVR